MTTVMTDAELFQDYLRTGDRAALDNLFTRHYPTVYHVVLKLVRNSADASDLTQATFLKALEAARAGRPPEALRPWLLGIAVNAVRDWKRGDRRRARGDWLFDACRRGVAERAPDLDAERRDFERALEEALEQFPEELAEPLVLHYYQDLSYAEVGQILGLSKTTVQFRMQRALEKLRERFQSRGLQSLASLIPDVFPRSSRLFAFGVALMNVKKIAVALLLLLVVGAVGRRVWTTRSSTTSAERASEATAVTAADRGKAPGDPRDALPAPGIFGTVFDQATRAPLPGVLIAGYDLETSQRLETLSDERGAWRLPALQGTWHLTISRAGYASGSVRGARVSAEPKDAFLSKGGTIKGRVVDPDGVSGISCKVLAVRKLYTNEDVFDLTAIHYRQTLPRDGYVDQSQTSYGENGAFLIVVPPDAAPFDHPYNQRLTNREVVLEVQEGAVLEVLIPQPRPATARIRVTDATTHQPIAGAVVQRTIAIDRTNVPVPECRRTTDAAGECLFPALLNERGGFDWESIGVSHEGYGTQTYDLAYRENVPVIEVKLGRTARIEGHVRGPDGRPLEGCAVYAEIDADGSIVQRAFTNAEGFYRTGVLPAPRHLEVYCFDPGLSRHRSMRPILLREGETRVLDFGTKAQAGISGTVKRKGAPCSRALICVDALKGDKHRSVFYADEQGAFSIEGLDPGPYELFVNAETKAAGSLYFTRRLTLAEGERKEFRFDAGARTIRGTLIDSVTLAPPSERNNVDVVARPVGSTDPVPPISTQSRADGTFELLLEAPGLYEVGIQEDHWGYYAADRLSVDLTREELVENLRLLVHRDFEDRTIRIHLRDQESGDPVRSGSYLYQFRGGSGAGSIGSDVIEDKDARIGPWKYKLQADGYLPELLTLELRPQDREVERTVYLRKSDAVKVAAVTPSSPADRAGLLPGDVLISCNGNRVRHSGALQAVCKAAPALQSVTLSVRRGATTLDIIVSEPELGIETENALSD